MGTVTGESIPPLDDIIARNASPSTYKLTPLPSNRRDAPERSQAL
jgi:hypothetical protein